MGGFSPARIDRVSTGSEKSTDDTAARKKAKPVPAVHKEADVPAVELDVNEESEHQLDERV